MLNPERENSEMISKITEESIKVTIANRIYPLKVTPAEKPRILKAAEIINDMMKEFEERYGLKDKQDYLAMCALQYVVEGLKREGYSNDGEENLEQRIDSLDELIDGILENK